MGHIGLLSFALQHACRQHVGFGCHGIGRRQVTRLDASFNVRAQLIQQLALLGRLLPLGLGALKLIGKVAHLCR
ncbi:MAG: hypothetical protein A2711_11320 [Burkholderiales bacterium RIFCSPHIGHO2_01_FULL_63_240]|nr:MAG: hypothetical protein A2711_11320 [Burkholderiales bacterium RIFCSPHIGHO2_01_FULL_63_240]